MIARLFAALLAAVVLLGADGAEAKKRPLHGRGGIVADFAITRTTSCVAPCYVHVDGTDATSGTLSARTTLPFHEIEYRWDFGDPTAGTWSAGAQSGVNSKNAAVGPMAGHVFETSGTYIVSLTASDGTATSTKTRTVTVGNADTVFSGTNTICFSTGADFTGCPGGATTATVATFASAAASAAPGKRVLLRKGDTFTASATVTIAASDTGSPWIVGAFGSGANPIIQRTAGFNTDVAVLNLSGASTPTMKDIRLMDLTFDGSLATLPIQGLALGTNGGVDQVTVLRLTANSLRLMVDIVDSLLNGGSYTAHHIWDQWAVVDGSVTNPPTGTASTSTWPYMSYMSGERLFYAGNSADLNGGAAVGVSHVARFTYLGKSIISNNSLLRPGPSEHALKLHGPDWSSGVAPTGQVWANSYCAGYTCKNVISDNKLQAGAGTTWIMAIGTEDTSSEHHLQDHIIERNWVIAGAGTQRGINYWHTYGTIRNNLVNMSGGTAHSAIYIGRRQSQDTLNLPGDHIWVYNNTGYSSDTDNDFKGIEVYSDTTNAFGSNNLFYAPNDSGAVTSGPITVSNNTSNLHTDPTFSGALTAVNGWTVSGYPKAAGGTGLHVLRDFFGTMRSASAPTIGAAE